MIAIVSTPLSAPGCAATRPHRGGTDSARGAAQFVADPLATKESAWTPGRGGSNRRQGAGDVDPLTHEARVALSLKLGRNPVVTRTESFFVAAWPR